MPAPKPQAYTFEAIGTQWRIETDEPLSNKLRAAIDAEIELFDREYSRFRNDSLITALANGQSLATFTHGVPELFGLYDSLFALTDGKVSPLVGDTLSALGYDSTYSLTPKKRRPVQDYKILAHNDQTLTLKEPAIIDVGAAGKGYLIDRLSALLRLYHASFVIDGSGDIYAHAVPQTIGLEDPNDQSRVIGHIEINNAAICGSASNRRSWGEGLHHIVDGTTGEPAREIIATWVVAETALLADGLATALFFAPPETLAAVYNFSFVLINRDGSVQYSPDSRITIYD